MESLLLDAQDLQSNIFDNLLKMLNDSKSFDEIRVLASGNFSIKELFYGKKIINSLS